MASKQTASEAFKLLLPVARLLEPLQLGMAALDSDGNLVSDERGRAFGKGSVNQGILPLLYKEMSKADLRRFILVSDREVARPTPNEMAAFKKRLLRLVRRVLNREISKCLEKLPPDAGGAKRNRHAGRPRRDPQAIEMICDTVAEYERRGLPTTKAVKKAADYFQRTPTTVWNYLRLGRRS